MRARARLQLAAIPRAGLRGLARAVAGFAQLGPARARARAHTGLSGPARARAGVARVRFLAPLLLGCLACEVPPPRRAVDAWLTAYTAGDRPTMLAHTATADRALVAAALTAQAEDPTASLALALPPRPLSHEVLDREQGGDDRQIFLTRLVLKNPLPYAGEKVGQPLPQIPRTRGQWRRFLLVREGKAWRVSLDLKRVMERTAFVTRFLGALERRDFDEAEALLRSVPPPPDVPESQVNKDRLPRVLGAELASARASVRPAGVATATSAARGLPASTGPSEK